MSEAPEAVAKSVGKKVGPLPLWGYAAIVVVAAYGVYWWKNKVGTSSPVTPITEVGSGMSSAGQMPGTNSYNGSVNQAEKAAPASTTNAQWARNTADSLIAAGSPPADVTQAISNYLSGKPLTPTQQSIINIALQKYGSPPEGLVAPVTAPSTGHLYTVKQGDTLDSIMQMFYGRVNPIDKRLVQQNNLSVLTWIESLGNFAALKPGDVLSLPTNGIAGVQNNTLNDKAGQ
jgi:nucleoid-associated protein YgaU